MDEDNYDIPNDIDSPKSISNDSIDSIPEFNKKIQIFFKIIFAIFSLISFTLGIIIFFYNDIYLLKNFKKSLLLFIFILSYTIGVLSSFLLSFIISIIMYLITFIFNYFNKSEIYNMKDMSNELDMIHKEEHFSIISYALAIFTLMIIIFYLASIPYGIYLLLNLIKDENYKKYSSYLLIYIFIGLNILIGVFMLLFFLYSVICFKPEDSILHNNNAFNNLDLIKVTNEIEMALSQYNIVE